MNKKIYLFFATLAVVFLFSFILYGCREEAAEPRAGASASEEAASEEVIIEDTDEDKTDKPPAVEEEMAVEETAEPVPISAERVLEIITEGEDYFILDVRSGDEYDSGHIQGAVLIPVSELEGRLEELPEDKPIIVYCRSGSRSASAAGILVENGFGEVYDMGGGITEWMEKGYPVEVNS